MDKNKSRTDLLAAGRKKLQQYRKKKDSKGNSSKSSGKSGKSGRDTSVSSAAEAEATTVKQHAKDDARSVQAVEFYDSSMESIDRMDSVASDIAVAGERLPAKTSNSDIASQSSTLVLPLEGSGVDQTSLNQSTNDGDSGALEKGELSTVPENAKDKIHNSSNTMIQREESANVGTFLPVDNLSNLRWQHWAEQVTDVGAMQDVGHSNANQNEGIISQIEGGGSLSSSGFNGAIGCDPVDDPHNATAAKEEINVTAQPSESDNTLLTDVAITDPEETQKRQDLSDVSVPSTMTSFASTGSSVINDQPREWLSYDSSTDEKTEVFHEAGSYLGFHTEGVQPRSEFTTESNTKSLEFREVDLSSVSEGSVVKLSQLAKILQLLGEDELSYLFKSKGLPVEKFEDDDQMKIQVSLLHDAFERLKEQLYVTNFSKDVLHLQLCEQKKLIDETGAVNASQFDVQGNNENLSEEIMRCWNEIQQVVSEREELPRQHQFSKADIKDFAVKANEQKNKLETAQKEISSLSAELVDCRNLVESLQAENQRLHESFKLMAKEKEQLSEANRNIMLENEKMSGALAQSKASIESLEALLRDEGRSHGLVGVRNSEARLQVEHNKSVYALQEASIRMDQLIKENEGLHANLEFYKSKLEEIDQKNSQIGKAENQDVGNDIGLMLKPKSDLLSLEPLKVNVYDDSSGFFALKRNLGSAEMVMRKLENEIESLLLHSTSNRSAKVGSPKVSRLIQAFESKGDMDAQDPEKSSAFENPEKSPAFENQTAEGLYMRTKMATDSLRVLLEELVNDAENASEFCKVMQNKLHNDAANNSDSMREHSDRVEAANIELMVLYEVMRSDIYHSVAKERELLNLCDNLQKQELILKSENRELRRKLNDFEIKITVLDEKMDSLWRDSDEKAASISNELQTLQAEVMDRELVLEHKWNSAFSQILHTVGELDSTLGTYANSFTIGQSNLDVIDYVAASVHSTRKMMEDLRGQLEVAYRDRQEALDKSDMSLDILHRLYNGLSELVPFGHHQNELQNFVADNVLDFIHSDVLNTLLDQLRRLLGERLQLESENEQLQAKLMARSMEIDHLDGRFLKPDTVDKLVEEIEHSVMLEGTEIDADESASRLESLIYLLVQKFKEADQGISISKSLEMQLSDLQGHVDHLNSILVQYDNENLVLKHSLGSAKKEITALNSMVKEKVAELEQSEQRVSSLREKLSIAVTKGKGLISHRDSLKQSLAETSKDLEKCSQELLSKDARLHELEIKLRVYSEAGVRMEALESELSYIRNSATALRESFLLKDSVLQRIEEILEDVELPEHFHSCNIIEKIEWLAKSFGRNSLPPGDWDQRRSAGVPTYSTTGFVGVEGLKEDIHQNSDVSDDFRRKYEELENKFYGLAEQNEMLEQSLMDMNNLVQRWEGLLNGMDMPSQLWSMEPEDKIQWLKTAWSEAQNHCYSLQLEIDNLETYCGSLAADLEDSHRRASELVSAFQMACVEKEILSRDLEILGHENELILENNADLVTTNENHQNKVSMFLEEKLQNENAIRRLEELVCDALQDYCTEDMILGQEGAKYLENMLGKLVEKYKTLSDKKTVSVDLINIQDTDKAQLSHASRDFEEQSVEILRKKLEDSFAEHMILKGERDQYMLNNQSAIRKVEELEIINKELEEQLYQVELESASFRATLDTTREDMTGEFANLKEEKARFKLENQSLLSQVEELEAKKKELQELLNQEELKSASMRETLNKKLDECIVELTILKEDQARYTISNQSLHHEIEELEMKKKDLQELLHQEELKSASLLELLNQEEQKSASFREALNHEVEELEMKKKELQELLHQEELKSASLQEVLNQEEQQTVSFREALGKKLEDYSSEMEILKGEKDKFEFSNQSLLHEVEVLEMKKKELQHLLHQEELKSTSLTEALNKRAQDSAGEMVILTNEKDRLMQDNRSLLSQIEELEIKKKELQGLLSQEEQKSSSLKEKLNLAVRKGKSLVQQRDSMKQVIEELNATVEGLKSEIKHAEKKISEYTGQTNNFFTVQERVQVLESEGAVLRNRLEETESSLLKKEDSWNRILGALENIDLGVAFSSGNPVEKLKEIGKYLTDLRAQMDSLKEESRKSKRAAELLLAELNEVQERNDSLQEELAKTFHDLSELSREKDSAENARCEALEQIEKLSQAHSDKDRQMSEILTLRYGFDSMREDLSSIEKELAYVLSKDFEVLQNLKSLMKSFLESGGISDFGVLFPGSFPRVSGKSENKVCMTEVSSIRELFSNHSQLLQEEASQLQEVLTNVHRGYTFYKEACESTKQDIKNLELIRKERESELRILRGNVSLLYETCVSTISEIENWKVLLAGNASASRSPESKLQSQLPIEGWNSSTNDIPKFSEEAIRSMQERLLFAVRDFISMQNDLVDVGQREMKNTILNLQKEIQEKDVHSDRVCTDLVNQIKEAETNAKNHLHELQQVKVQLHDSQKQLNVMEEEHKVLEQRMKELQDQETNSKDMQQKVDSLADALSGKVQESEALMQALDAQEAEMEDLTNTVASLENVLQEKNKGWENLETSRAKALKKLSVTVSKFDELHSFSESLLSEVEKLQSLLQERDGEISFLRQEVTRCTNDALSITELSKRSSDEVHDLLSWLDSLISRVEMNDITSDDLRSQPVNEYKEAMQKKFMDLVSELENLRVEVQKNGVLLKKERSKVEDLAQKEQYLKNSLHEKETQLVMLQEAGDSTKAMKSPSEIVEVEQRSNKRATSGAVASQFRSLRKTNSDQVAIAIDADNNDDMLEEDDDKAHGFKSLTTSKFVPRFTRPVSDLVDGLWVSCDRALMRQPALRLCVMMYWAVLHTMLATFFV